jgi:hypothetical protein
MPVYLSKKPRKRTMTSSIYKCFLLVIVIACISVLLQSQFLGCSNESDKDAPETLLHGEIASLHLQTMQKLSAAAERGRKDDAATLSHIMAICETTSRGWEVLTKSLLAVIFCEEGFLPSGGVLHVGAQFGEQACHFALLTPKRKVHAVEPSSDNIKKIKNSRFGALPELHVTRAVLEGMWEL